MNQLTLSAAGLVASALLCSACAIKAVIPDRHTVMEDEAAGEWPEFERELLEKTKESAPTAFQKVGVNSEKQRLYSVLNGELANPGK